MSSVDLKSLFEESRFPNGWAAVTLLLYSPIGLVLAVLRTFIAFQALLAAALLPELSVVRRFVLRCMCVVLGIVVKEEDVSQRSESARVLLSNHITPCDHLAIHILTSSVFPCSWGQPAIVFRILGVRNFSQGSDAMVAAVKNHLENYSTPVLVMPEGSTTNGKIGLLKFAVWPFLIGEVIQPLVLRIWRPYLTNVAPTALATSVWADIFWFLFSPITVFTVKYLPVMEREENETDMQFSTRVQKAMADALGIVPTKYTCADKAEYEKRYLLEQSRPVVSAPTINSELQRMAHQVRDVLPHVPYDVIIRDLSRTRSVDVTISNILEGHTSYIPITNSQPATIPNTSVSSLSTVSPAASSSQQGASCLDTSAPTFPRSAQERMLSFHERKARLIENARQKYIEKHGLKIAGYNC